METPFRPILLVLALAFVTSAPAAPDPFYGKTILLPAALAPKLNVAATDLAGILRQVTGHELTVGAEAAPDAPAIPPETRGSRGRGPHRQGQGSVPVAIRRGGGTG